MKLEPPQIVAEGPMHWAENLVRIQRDALFQCFVCANSKRGWRACTVALSAEVRAGLMAELIVALEQSAYCILVCTLCLGEHAKRPANQEIVLRVDLSLRVRLVECFNHLALQREKQEERLFVHERKRRR